MLSRTEALVALCLASALSLGCKERQETLPLPPPEPPASATPLAPHDDALSAPKRKPSDDESDASSKAKRPAADVARPLATASTATAAAGGAPAGSTTPLGVSGAAALPALPSALPGIALPSAACLSRCQGAMQGCLSAPVDGGVPGFANLDLCKKAFEACQAACK